MKCYSSDKRRKGFKAMNAKVNVLFTETWSVEWKIEASIKRWLVKKKFEFFWALAYEKTKTKHDLPPLLSRFLCSSLLFVDDLFSGILPILAPFLTFSRDFLDSLYAVYPLVSLIGLSLSIQPTCIFTQNPLSTNLNLNNFLRLTKL